MRLRTGRLPFRNEAQRVSRQNGHSVVATDISRVAIDKARRLAKERGVDVDFIRADLTDWDWPEEGFDAVIAIFIQFARPRLRNRMFDDLRRTL